MSLLMFLIQILTIHIYSAKPLENIWILTTIPFQLFIFTGEITQLTIK